MSDPSRHAAWLGAIIGALWGLLVTARDSWALWQSLGISHSELSARALGAALAGAVLGWLIGYAVRLWRRR